MPIKSLQDSIKTIYVHTYAYTHMHTRILTHNNTQIIITQNLNRNWLRKRYFPCRVFFTVFQNTA